jgi:hypothetical protein
MAVVVLLLLLVVTVSYALNPEPAESPMVSILINGSIGLITLLSVILAGMVLRDGGSSTY